MNRFERQIIGEIPIEEAASFFIGMKQPSLSSERVKSASSRMQGSVQGTISELLAGKMPEGKFGRFKPVDQIKEASARMKTAAVKLGFAAAGAGEAEPNMEGGQPSPAASNLPAQAGAGGSMAPPEGPVQDPQAAKPTTEPTVPVNYMGAELLARAAQQANEVGFLKERLNAATEQNNMMTQQLQSVQGQVDQLGQTSQAASDQIMQATNEAVAASDRALQHSMQAANMRIGIQKMREAMMELASQDPESMGTLAQQQAVQEETAEQQAVNGAAGTPAQAPSQGTAPGTPAAEAPEEGGAEEKSDTNTSEPDQSKTPQVQIKTGMFSSMRGALPGALAGASLAGLHSMKQGRDLPEAQAKVDQLEGEQEGGSFSKALQLARAKKNLADSEVHAKHPGKAGLMAALGGAGGGAMLGMAAHDVIGALKR